MSHEKDKLSFSWTHEDLRRKSQALNWSASVLRAHSCVKTPFVGRAPQSNKSPSSLNNSPRIPAYIDHFSKRAQGAYMAHVHGQARHTHRNLFRFTPQLKFHKGIQFKQVIYQNC